MVTLTHRQSYLNDCDSITGFTKTDDGNTSTFTIDNDDYFKLDVTVSGGNEETKVVNDANIGRLTTAYPLILFRYKTSNSNIKAKIIAEFTGAEGTQEVLADSSSTSNRWTVGSETLDLGKTLDHIHVYADHATGTVRYDFILVCEGQFALPNVAYGMNMDLPPQEALIGIPGRDTNVTQNLGTESALINIGCDLDQGTWKRSGDTIDGEVFLDMLHNRSGQPWQWLDTGSHQFKVTVHPKFSWENRGNVVGRRLDLILKEHSLGSKADEFYEERFGIG